ncbi:MAG: hypothetical protein QW453_03455 [Thermoprotei archaeon]
MLSRIASGKTRLLLTEYVTILAYFLAAVAILPLVLVLISATRFQ